MSAISKGEDTDTLNLGAPVSYGNHNNLQTNVCCAQFDLNLYLFNWICEQSYGILQIASLNKDTSNINLIKNPN